MHTRHHPDRRATPNPRGQPVSHLLVNERNEPIHTTQKHGGRLAAAPFHFLSGPAARLSEKSHTRPTERPAGFLPYDPCD